MEKNTFHLTIVTPTNIYIDKEVNQVSFPTMMGRVCILPHHGNIVGNASNGIVKIVYPDFKEQKCGMNHGMYWFKENRLVIITDFFAEKLDINTTKVFEEMKKQIEEGLAQADLSENSRKQINMFIAKTSARVKKHKN